MYFALMFIIKSLTWGKIIALFGIFVKKGGKNQENCFFSRSLRNFGEDLERSRGVIKSGSEKSPGPRGTRNRELLLPSLDGTMK